MWRAARGVLAIAALIAALSLAVRVLEQMRRPVAPAQRPAGVPPELDTGEVRILNFYAPQAPERGRPFTLCYGVVNAVKVEMDPPLAELFPSISRCVQVTLQKDTRATLTAYGKDGRAVRVQIDLPVREPQPEILFVEVSSREIRRGGRFTLCYGVRGAARVRVEPGGMNLPVSPRHCATWFPVQAPEKLIAESPAGRVEAALTVRMEANP